MYQATQRGEVRTVHKLQNLLSKSWYARLLAVRRVTQDNRGRHTAGIDGVKRSADPGDIGGQGRSPLPPTLLHAVEEFEGDSVVAGVLDAAGDGVASYFARVKRDEFFAYHSAVTPWEIDSYLTAF